MSNPLFNTKAAANAKAEDLPDRNAPCSCGSGKKFKKCCLPRMESDLAKRLNRSASTVIREPRVSTTLALIATALRAQS